MSSYIAEITGSKMRAENIVIGNLLEDIEVYGSFDEYAHRIGTKELSAEGVVQEMLSWVTEADNFGLLFTSQSEDEGSCIRVIIEPTLVAEYDHAINKASLTKTPLNNYYQTHDARVRNRILLVLETVGELGKAYLLLKAWSDVRSIRETEFFSNPIAI